MHSYLKSLPRTFAHCFCIAIAVAGALLAASCSKPYNQNRYDWAMELAKSYTVQSEPKDFLANLGPSLAKAGYSFTDITWNHNFQGKFATAADELDKQTFFADNNRYLLEGIVADSKLSCDFNGESFNGNINCGDLDGALIYRSEAVRLLHTDAGDFIFSSADMDRGNGNESNDNASAIVIVVDPTDGGFGMILEDHIAIVGGRHDVIAAALTLASSIVRLEDQNSSAKLSPDNLRFDLHAAKSNTLFKKPTYVGDDAALHKLTPAQAQQVFEEVARRMAGPASGTPAPANQSAAQDTGGPLTKDQFENMVLGKTMAEVRSAIGDPSNVDSHADGVMWFYWSNKLPVRDPDSGVIFTSSSILFDPDSKIAVKVGF